MEKNIEKLKPAYSMDFIRYSESNFSLSKSTRYIIMRFYRENLNIGKGDNLTYYADIRKEILKLNGLIKSEDFKEKYGHDFNIIDMYLTTNLQVRDLFDNYIIYIEKTMMVNFLNFIKKELLEIDKLDSYRRAYIVSSKSCINSRFYRPSQRGIDQIADLNFINYTPLDASLSDANKAHEILLDLNEKYGVKYDDISMYIVLRSYLKGEIDSYYKVAEDYKEELDKHTHVQKRCIPLLTRREKN